jgi:hypothetical protein
MTSREKIRREWLKCEADPSYFIYNYVKIYDATEASWVPFALWPMQFPVVDLITEEQLSIILKARQLGMTWLCLSYVLWKMVFHPAVTAMLFSRRDDEATYLLDFRLKGMYKRLPEWMHVKKIYKSNTDMWQLSNGSIAYAFPTTAGDSYTASIAVVDEADLVPDLDSLLNAVKPTIDGGGQMILLSRSNKDTPGSTFKKMYTAARDGKSPWKSIFLPWWARPSRDQEWYDNQVMDVLSRTGSMDDLYQQYPAKDTEALMPRTMDKRIPPMWLEQVFQESKPIENAFLGLPGFTVYEEPSWNLEYVIGADPAEGNPTSDPTSAHVVEKLTGREVARLAGQFEPTVFAGYLIRLSAWYNDAHLLVERNNHGHAVISHVETNSNVQLLSGYDGRRGWSSNIKGKALVWTSMADAARDKQCLIRSKTTYEQLQSIEGATLRAPKGLHDDEAMSYALAIRAAAGEDNAGVAYNYDDNIPQVLQVGARIWGAGGGDAVQSFKTKG